MMTPLKYLDHSGLTAELLATHPDLQPAIELATELHAGQKRRAPRAGKTKLPYIEHPLRVATRLQRAGASNYDLLEAAVLHDTVEDCMARIGNKAGAAPTFDVAVKFLATHHSPTAAETVALLSVPTQASYAEHVRTAVEQDAHALLVKVSDWVDNAGSLHHSPTPLTRLARKYRPLERIFLSALDQHQKQVDHLLNGNTETMREKVVRIGSRLDGLVDIHPKVH